MNCHTEPWFKPLWPTSLAWSPHPNSCIGLLGEHHVEAGWRRIAATPLAVVVVFVNVNEYLPLRTLVKREGSSGSTPSGSPTSATGASTRSSRLRLVMWFRIQRLSPPSGLRSSRWCAVQPPPNLASLLYPHNIRALSPLLILDRLVLCRSVVSPFPPEGQGVRSPSQEPASGKV